MNAGWRTARGGGKTTNGWDWNLVVSEFFPEAPWLAGRAMQRNRTICALSRAMVLIEARATGGTFAAGEAALAMGVPLFTADYSAKLESNDGNRILLERGGVALRRGRATGRANLGRLFELARGAEVEEERGEAADGQQELFSRWGRGEVTRRALNRPERIDADLNRFLPPLGRVVTCSSNRDEEVSRASRFGRFYPWDGR